MGDGTQKIVGADPSTGIDFQLQMTGNGFLLNGRIAFEPLGTGTQVTWTDFGEVGKNPLYRYMAALMDKVMGPAFEKSLSALKQKSESAVLHPQAGN